MAKEVIMPALGMAQETGTLLAWLKQAGDTVVKGEPLMTVATDKTDVEIEANASGILTNVTAKVGDEVPVGQAIALIQSPEEVAAGKNAAPAPVVQPASPPPPPVAPTAPPISNSAVAATPVAVRLAAEHKVDLSLVKAGGSGKIQKEDVLAYLDAQAPKAQPVASGRVLASPKARRLAQEQNVDLATVNGTGPEGAVLAADVLGAQPRVQADLTFTLSQPAEVAPVLAPEPTAAQDSAGEVIPMSRPWRIMAQRLQQSWTTVPHFYLEREANATALVRWREGVQTRTKAKITYTDLLVKLVAATLRKHPRLNASWINEQIVLNQAINVGLAVAVDEGLLVPVVHNADRLGLGEIATRRNEVVTQAQAGKLKPDDLSQGTFTISNLGMYGIDAFNAIVNPPQAAILAVGRIADRVVPVNGQPGVQPMTTLTLSCDHRVVDGARAAQFMQALVGLIEDPLSALD